MGKRVEQLQRLESIVLDVSILRGLRMSDKYQDPSDPERYLLFINRYEVAYVHDKKHMIFGIYHHDSETVTVVFSHIPHLFKMKFNKVGDNMVDQFDGSIWKPIRYIVFIKGKRVCCVDDPEDVSIVQEAN